MFLRKIWPALLVACLMTMPLTAQETKYDGLKLLGSGGTLVDKQSDSEMTLHAFNTKYQEDVVGIYITQHGKEVRFYMNSANWDKLKQQLIMTRDRWETLSPTEFAETGTVRGYRIANNRSTLRVSIQGATELDKKRLDFSATGGDNSPARAFVSINHAQLKTMVEQLYKVDELLR
jgi:hypothetical protein